MRRHLYGRLMDEMERRFWDRVGLDDGCWPWLGKPNVQGYGQLRGRGTMLTAHRLSWELHHGPIPQGKWICHHCDNHICVRPDHLFLGTPKDNTHDMIRKDRQWFTALSDDLVQQILAYPTGAAAMRELGLGRTTVYRVRQGRMAHVRLLPQNAP
jgi:hypothetical protein